MKTLCVTFTAVQMRMEIGENGKLVMRNVEENKQGLNFVPLSPAKHQHLQRNKTALLVSESLKKKLYFGFAKKHFCVGEWAVWGEWISCSTTCGAGTRSRSRTCPIANECAGDAQEQDNCPDNLECPSTSTYNGELYFIQYCKFLFF